MSAENADCESDTFRASPYLYVHMYTREYFNHFVNKIYGLLAEEKRWVGGWLRAGWLTGMEWSRDRVEST